MHSCSMSRVLCKLIVSWTFYVSCSNLVVNCPLVGMHQYLKIRTTKLLTPSRLLDIDSLVESLPSLCAVLRLWRFVQDDDT